MGEEKPQQESLPGQGNAHLSGPAHALSYPQVANEIEANRTDGLTGAEAAKRLEQYGRNELQSGGGVQPVKILIGQIANAMILVMPTIPY